MSSPITINLNRYKGYAKASKFVFSSQFPSLSDVKYIRWSFGDGNVTYDLNEVEHYYSVPGEYQVTTSGYTTTSFVSAQTSIQVVNFLKEAIYFETIPPPTFAGHFNRYPFRVNITSSNDKEHWVDLYAQFSRSYPYQEPQHKWSFLKPQWRFLDLSGNQIWSVKTTDYPIKIDTEGAITPNGLTVGVTGYAEFYFIDDLYNYDLAVAGQPYTTIWATLQTSAIRVKADGFNVGLDLPGHSNSTSIAFAPYVVTQRFPEQLDITENGIRPHINPRWTSSTTPIVIKAGYNESFDDYWIDGTGIREYDKEANFARYIPLESDNIPITAVVLNLSTQFTPTPQFQWIDETEYKVGGYYKGSFITDTPFSLNTHITAGAYVLCKATSANYFNPLIWLSNPQAGTFSIAQYYLNTSTAFSAISTPNFSNVQIKTFNMPVIQNVDFEMDAMALSGFHGIYSIAALPSPTYHAWMADSEMDQIYRLNGVGQPLCAIDLKKIINDNNLGYLVPKKVSPAHIALDSQFNLFVTLYDTVSTLKFDSAGRYLSAFHPINQGVNYNYPYNYYRFFIENSYFQSDISGEHDYNIIEPTSVEVDKFDNVWVSYSNSFSGIVIKYDNNGNLINSFFAPVCTTPQELISDKNGNVWISNAALNWNAPGSVQKRSSTGTLLSSFNGIRNPNYLTLDLNQDLWFSFGFNKLGYIQNQTGTMQVFTVSGVDLKPTDYPKRNLPFDSRESSLPWWDDEQNADETAIEGIACDQRGYIYVIHSIENQVYVLNSWNKKLIGRFYVNPQGFLFYLNDQEQPTRMSYYLWTKSLQAHGDWTGYRWTNKFGSEHLPYYTDTSLTYLVTGISPLLNFYDRSIYTAFKINEDFNLGNTMQNLAQIPILKDSNDLFQNFLGAIFGKEPFYQDDLGITAFEKIANFVGNNSDPDTCEIPQLYNMAQLVDYNADDFLLNYPTLIKRAINFGSINISKLMGTNCNCGSQYNLINDCATREICSYCGKEKASNRGELLNNLTYTVSAGTPIVLKTKSLDLYQFIPTGKIDNNLNYTLYSLACSIGLPSNWADFYEFYEFVNIYNGGVTENLIDWNSEQTTLSRNLSTANDWFKEEGILDLFFNYALYKGLDLLKDE